MGYKIRNKSIYWTLSGWKNNYSTITLLAPLSNKPPNLFSLKSYQNHHSFLRAYQCYRNMSRTCKQNLFNDREMENIFTLSLKRWFVIPITCETPTHLLKYGGERRFIDQAERDYELMNYNQHPYQMRLYDVHNKLVREDIEEKQKHDNGDKSEEEFQELLNYNLDLEKNNLSKGEKIDIEKFTEIFFDCLRMHEKNNEFNKNEENLSKFENFNEVRRPFLEPENEKVSN